MDSRARETRARVKITPREESAFLAWGDFHVRSRFARSTIPEEKWVLLVVYSNLCSIALLAPWYYRFLITAILSGVIGIIIFSAFPSGSAQ